MMIITRGSLSSSKQLAGDTLAHCLKVFPGCCQMCPKMVRKVNSYHLLTIFRHSGMKNFRGNADDNLIEGAMKIT